MKKLAVLIAFVLAGTAAHAETVLICHAQSVPEALGANFRSPLSSALVQQVFDFYFDRGDIAFDTDFSLEDGAPSTTWLGTLSARYGADKVLYVQVTWKKGTDGRAELERIDYEEVGPHAKVIRQGSFKADLVSGAKDEDQQVKAVTERVLALLSS
jgi:hypothetical protein